MKKRRKAAVVPALTAAEFSALRLQVVELRTVLFEARGMIETKCITPEAIPLLGRMEKVLGREA